MIPWVREKLAERRARWIASRKRNDRTTAACVNPSSSMTTTTNQNATQRVDAEKQNSTTSKLKSKETTASSTTASSSKSDFRRVKVFTPTGQSQTLHIGTNTKLVELKQLALDKFSEDPASLPTFAPDIRTLYSHYRLIRPEATTLQNEGLTIDEAKVEDNEIFLLNVKRANPFNDADSLRGPTAEEIREFTKNIQVTETTPPRVDINELVLQSDLQFDVRKVLISLAQSSAYIIGAGPYASRLITMLRQRLINKRRYKNDTVQCLVDMGFSKEKVLYALKINNDVYATALDWLVENENSVEEIPDDDVSNMTSSTSKSFHATSITENIEALLDIVRIYSHSDVPPSQEMIQALIAMGFPEKEVVNALKVTRNNQSAACEWLCGNRNSSLTELRDGLPVDSPILKAMMESPQVQMSLNNPRIFLAYLSMLENHNALSMWLGDTDTSSVLSHILRKYHEEKHILGINQFNNIR